MLAAFCTLITGAIKTALLFTTTQASQIAHLIKDYTMHKVNASTKALLAGIKNPSFASKAWAANQALRQAGTNTKDTGQAPPNATAPAVTGGKGLAQKTEAAGAGTTDGAQQKMIGNILAGSQAHTTEAGSDVDDEKSGGYIAVDHDGSDDDDETSGGYIAVDPEDDDAANASEAADTANDLPVPSMRQKANGADQATWNRPQSVLELIRISNIDSDDEDDDGGTGGCARTGAGAGAGAKQLTDAERTRVQATSHDAEVQRLMQAGATPVPAAQDAAHSAKPRPGSTTSGKLSDGSSDDEDEKGGQCRASCLWYTVPR